MKHKHSELGFSLELLLILVVVVAALGFGGWYSFTHQRLVRDDIGSNTNNFIPGDISVSFKDAVTFQQAAALVKSYGLEVRDPAEAEQDFIPVSYRAIKADQFIQIQSKLKDYPEVSSFIDDSSDSSNRAGTGEKWVKVTWREDVTYNRIKTIIVESGLGAPTQPQGIARRFDLKTPDGQEDNYINKFKQSPIVATAARVGHVILQ